MLHFLLFCFVFSCFSKAAEGVNQTTETWIYLFDLTFGSVFSPHRLHRWTQMFCLVMRFFLHRFDFVELKVLSNCTDYCRRKRRWLMSKTSRMAGAIEAPTICAIRKNLSEKKFVSICVICGQKNASGTSSNSFQKKQVEVLSLNSYTKTFENWNDDN